jgi:hypothetical protein
LFFLFYFYCTNFLFKHKFSFSLLTCRWA